MLALIAALALSSPSLHSPPPEPPCRLWYSRTEHRCRDEDVEIIGSWDPRPSPAEWDHNAYQNSPADWPAFPLEKRTATTNEFSTSP